jgi:hypothetical protein
MSAILERIRSIRETVLSGQMAQGLLGQSVSGPALGSIRSNVAAKAASALKVAPPPSTASLPIIDVLHTKIQSIGSTKSVISTGTSTASAQRMYPQAVPPGGFKPKFE